MSFYSRADATGVTAHQDGQELHLTWHRARTLARRIHEHINTENAIRRQTGTSPIQE